jgi:hypothetical protein
VDSPFFSAERFMHVGSFGQLLSIHARVSAVFCNWSTQIMRRQARYPLQNRWPALCQRS